MHDRQNLQLQFFGSNFFIFSYVFEVAVFLISVGTMFHTFKLNTLAELRPYWLVLARSSHPEVFLRKGVLKIYSTFTAKHLCRSAISVTLLCNFIERILLHGCSPANLLHIFRTIFPKNTSRQLLLELRPYRLLLAELLRNSVYDLRLHLSYINKRFISN